MNPLSAPLICRRFKPHPLMLALLWAWRGSALAQSADAQAPDALPVIEVREGASVAERRQLPQTSASVTAAAAADGINVTDSSDALKYLPSLSVRKRYIGDTQSPLATRTTGINASARSLVYADGILLSALVNNNNGNGSPRWFMVAPEEMARIDVMYGPFAAEYPGNSYGAVTEIVTRMPQQFEASAKALYSQQDFSQYGASGTYRAQEYNLALGNRDGALAWRFSANHLDSFSPPVTYVTANAAPAGVTGAVATQDRTGKPVFVLGAGNLTHTVQDSARLKLSYDFTPALTLSYTLGMWQNQANANAQTFLKNAANGAPAYGGGFSANSVDQQQWMQGLELRSKTEGVWDWQLAASTMTSSRDLTRTSAAAFPAGAGGGAGTIADAGGTGWSTLDAKGIWRPSGADGKRGAHVFSFGAHYDRYTLATPTWNTADWISGGNGALASDSRGKTETSALWAQDVWRLAPSLKATLGARYEWWRAFGGYNYSTNASGVGFPVNQPQVSQDGVSPKASLAWSVNDDWLATLSAGRALRFPTVGELYQNVLVGGVYLQANPNLKPEKVWSTELAIERALAEGQGKWRLSLFEERVSDALISQSSTLGSGVASFTQNVDKTRQRGIEAAFERNDVMTRGLSFNGSLTWVDARILANGGYVPTAAGATSVGKRTPYVPEWRATLVATYKPDDRWSYTLAGRYSARVYATVDNTDVNSHTYQGFDGYTVLDARVRYRFDRHWSAAVGVDNLTNRDYFLFHPFPQRTVFAELKYDF
ncbi:TonB-dependent receptor [Herbaspirillum sp. WKF16]|uniref:TonB-dependent receptor n=1 Tax=Herbaspirillum sp. WKF16 TaxID=3028312 RepID=UPI0023A9FB6F|nr:TonB-dependent receptor [Herbaspirillum sp. WKF16]WDZ97539.1 TonB-dependent receptor [Herbaspirillum sp. WKF16]